MWRGKGRIGTSKDQQDVAELLAALEGEKAQRSALRRLRIVNALGRRGDSDAVEMLSTVLMTDPSAEVRSMAVVALERIGDPSGAPALRMATSSRLALDQMRAIRALGTMGDRGSVPWLIARLQSTDYGVRIFAADALGQIGDQAAVPPLIEAMKDPKARVREAAASALARLGDSRALEPIRLAHRSAKGLSRWQIGRALSRLEVRLGAQGELEGSSSKFPEKWVALEQRLEFPSLVKSLMWNRMKVKSREQELAEATDQGRRLFSAGTEQETFRFLEDAVQRFPDDPHIRWLYASILLAFRPEDVASEAAKAVELDPDNPWILVGSGHHLLFGGEQEAARDCADRANELVQPDSPLMASLSNLNGLLASLDGQDDVAEKNLRSAVEGEPDNGPFARSLAVFLAKRGRLAEGAAVLDEALKHVEDNDELECMRDQMAREAGQRT